MGEMIRLTAADGHEFDAYKAVSNGTPKGGICVIQEIFGANAHIREVTDGYAAAGYLAIAPALYDRAERGVDLGYTPEDMQAGRDFRAKVGDEGPVADITAVVKELQSAGKVGTVGYCWGGTLSFLAATRVDGVAGSVIYYGGQIVPYKDETSNAPLLMHFGDMDAGIPMEDVDQIKAAQPQADVHIYNADHGFNCDHRSQYDEDSCRVARERSLVFFAQNLG
jgi:carboxymethylenebutenolidase